MKKQNKQKGITIISLVITIIVLIILAGVSVALIYNSSIFTTALEAKEQTNKQTATEKINLKITHAQMNSYAEKQEMPSLKELSYLLRDDEEIEYVTQTSKLASAQYDVTSDNPSSIYTKLKDYPYEFEINSSLQLASIDGIKIATTNNNNTSQCYIDTSKLIATISKGVEYEATENCIITGTIQTYTPTGGNVHVSILIDGVTIGNVHLNYSRWMHVPVYYPLKKGQKILFNATGADGATILYIYAYATL